MKEQELDAVYTQLCRAMTEVGEQRAYGVLSRFALLAMLEISDPERLAELIRRASQRA